MSEIKLSRWDAAEVLKDDQDCVMYLAAIMDEADGDEKLIAAAIGDIARARGMMQVSRDTGMAREALYRALSSEGNPSFATVLKVTKALGIKLTAVAADAAAA
jgi:probable addiction module antidote protein